MVPLRMTTTHIGGYMRNYFMTGALAVLVTACQSADVPPQEAFMANLNALCGQSFEGAVTSDDPQDTDWRESVLTVHIRDCADSEVKIPLHVGDDRSRTWIISKTDDGLRLKHDHRHEDGTPDSVTMYGGDTINQGTPTTQSFPVDMESKDMFDREGLTVSKTNLWSVSIDPGQSLTYTLSRRSRFFQAKFDLTKPVATPPPVWGYTP